jgi:endonuclease/exonuclease/phosphatase family metal-dependent hydrolase
LGNAEEPVLLGVDVNETASGLAWRTLADGRVDAAAAGGTTVPTFSVRSPRRRIDAIFTDPRCQVMRCQVLDSVEVRRASDHFPLLAEVELP